MIYQQPGMTSNSRAVNQLLHAINRTTSALQTGMWDLRGPEHGGPATDKHDWRNQLSADRGMRNFTWELLNHTLVKGGFSFCAVPKDGWCCRGQHYVNVLHHTRPFNFQNTYNHVKPGSVILGDGNSYLAQLWAPVLCSDQVLLWKVDGWSSNSYIGYDPGADILLVLLDNDLNFNEQNKAGRTNERHLLKRNHVQPNVIFLGQENPLFGDHVSPESARVRIMNREFPGVPLLYADGLAALNSDHCKGGDAGVGRFP